MMPFATFKKARRGKFMAAIQNELSEQIKAGLQTK